MFDALLWKTAYFENGGELTLFISSKQDEYESEKDQSSNVYHVIVPRSQHSETI